jgi:hypothetical protein
MFAKIEFRSLFSHIDVFSAIQGIKAKCTKKVIHCKMQDTGLIMRFYITNH